MNVNFKSPQLYRKIWLSLATATANHQFVEPLDVKTFNRRLDGEGLSFLTTTLPTIGKALDVFHATGTWVRPPEFKGSCYPLFLGLPCELAVKGSSAAVKCVRQLSYTFYRLKADYDQSLKEEKISEFVSTDASLRTTPYGNDPLLKSARRLIHEILGNVDPFDIRPSHSSGATACRTRNWEKYYKVRFSQELDECYPYADHFFASYSHLADNLEVLQEAEELSHRARMILVPKDSRGPRIISCEPAELMFIQQGQMKLLVRTIEAHPLTRNRISFRDQSINNGLARISSQDNTLATLDLKDASDRVSLELVRYLFPSDWFRCLLASRSKETLLPNGDVVLLNKFAPMGSACCFPVESLVFWAISTAATEAEFGYCPPRAARLIQQRIAPDRWRAWAPVSVYGDDIICPASCSDAVISALETYDLVVNRQKSYTDGPFRESCGGDYHLGVDVTPVRFKEQVSGSPTFRESCIQFLNNYAEKYGADPDLVSFFEDHVGPIPVAGVDIPSALKARLGYDRSGNTRFRRRFNRLLHRLEYRIPLTVANRKIKRNPQWEELLRTFLSTNGDVIATTALEKVTKAGEYIDSSRLKRTWKWTWLG